MVLNILREYIMIVFSCTWLYCRFRGDQSPEWFNDKKIAKPPVPVSNRKKIWIVTKNRCWNRSSFGLDLDRKIELKFMYNQMYFLIWKTDVKILIDLLRMFEMRNFEEKYKKVTSHLFYLVPEKYDLIFSYKCVRKCIIGRIEISR